MKKKLVSFVMLSSVLFSMLAPTTNSEETAPWWNDNWSFQKEINIPIDTSEDHAKYQPIDIPIEFINPCWGKNENEHSIRVIYWDEKTLQRLESQIYELTFIDGYIKSCNLVFLIPEYANGKEKYFVYYDDEEKSAPEYKDRVGVEDSQFTYDKIPTLPIEEQYFKVTEEGYIIYHVAKDGTFMNPISQQVTKLKPGVKNVMLKSRDNLASFDLTYWYKDNGWNPITTIWKYKSDEIFVDGNLMVKFGIVSRSQDDFFQTTALYKYYYTPLEDKRIYAHVKHELLKFPVPIGDEVDLTYLMLKSGGIKSSALREFNFGEILPYLHVYGEDEQRKEFNVPYPENNGILISKEDDIDLGSRAWVSVDEGENGKAHAIIFASNKVIKNGTDEKDGIEIEMEGSRYSYIQGFDGRFIEIYLLRNASKDEQIPEDFVVEFDAEYFTTESGGYKTVEKEVDIYQNLIKFHPTKNGNLIGDKEEVEKYCLKTYVHFAPSFPLGSVLSLATGSNFPYISVEVYDKEKSISTKACERLPVKRIPTSSKYIEIIKQIPEIFDFKNFSFLKFVKFDDLPPDKYLIKVWRENSIFGDKRQYIGYQIVDLKENSTTKIICSPEGKVDLTILDQNDDGVENVQAFLMKDDFIISEAVSNPCGKLRIAAPCGLRENYKLIVVYKGFLVYEEDIRLGYISTLNPLSKIVNLELHNLSINVKDGQGDNPEFNIDMTLTSDVMKYPINIPIDNVSNGNYAFFELYPETYTLTLNYKSFEIEKIVIIPKIKSLAIDLYNLEVLVRDNWDLSPGIHLDMVITTIDFKKPVLMLGEQLSNGHYLFTDLYEGNYEIKFSYKSFSLDKDISIPYEFDEMLELNFHAEFNLTMNIFDTRGNLLPGVNAILMRDGEQQEKFTNKGGNATFKIPPGKYYTKIYSGDTLIAERNIDITSGNSMTIATIQEPWYPYIIIGIMILTIIGAAYINYNRKDIRTFVKILAIALAIMAIVSPWWVIYGCTTSTQVETSSSLYLVPLEFVTITSTTDIVAGEVSSLEKTFEFVMSLLPILIVIGCISIILNMFFKKSNKKIFSKIFLLVGLLLLLVSILIFSIGMSQFAEFGVGSFIGRGDIGLNIPGEGIYEIVPCSWGPNIGFYLLLFSLIILIIITLLSFKRILMKKLINFEIRKI